uniref:Uncharacterized protein n=1 Tax=Anopheles minimus TaxID=112268 RepID=A0A182WQD0_9DIPT
VKKEEGVCVLAGCPVRQKGDTTLRARRANDDNIRFVSSVDRRTRSAVCVRFSLHPASARTVLAAKVWLAKVNSTRQAGKDRCYPVRNRATSNYHQLTG